MQRAQFYFRNCSLIFTALYVLIIVWLVLVQWEKDSLTNIRFGRLNLVDLAGSERFDSSIVAAFFARTILFFFDIMIEPGTVSAFCD